MYIDKVNISETHEIINGEKILRWKKIEANVHLNEGEDSMQGANYVQEFINEWNNRTQYLSNQYKSIGVLYTGNDGKADEVVLQQPAALTQVPQKSKEERYIWLIENATSVNELTKTYAPLAKNYPSIKEALDKKLKELNNQL